MPLIKKETVIPTSLVYGFLIFSSCFWLFVFLAWNPTFYDKGYLGTFWLWLIMYACLVIVVATWPLLEVRLLTAKGIHRKLKRVITPLKLEEEQLHDYVGIKGTYKGYFIRMYADSTDNYSPGITVLLYYRPLGSENGKIDFLRLRIIADTYTDLREVGNCYLRAPVQMAFYTIKSVEVTLDYMVDIATTEKLNPITEDEVLRLMKMDHAVFIPPTGIFRDAMRIELRKEKDRAWG